VHHGDSLWKIAAAHLPHGASDARIAESWPNWWAANRHAIGSDPNYLTPGQVLHAPPKTETP
jgi:nucleoid-associated protein YgaU